MTVGADGSGFSREEERWRALLAERDREIKGLRMENLFLNTLFDGINEEIMVLDADFNIKEVNRAFLDKYGFEKDQVLGEKCYKIKEGSDTPCRVEEGNCPLIRTLKTGERVEMTHFHLAPDGPKKELILIMYPLRGDEKEASYFLEIARDVTEYRSLIRKLQASEKKFKAILDTATDAILSSDRDHKIVLFNNAAKGIFGYTREEVLGRDLGLLIPMDHDDNRDFERHLSNQRESRILGQTISLTGRRKTGEEFPIDLSLSYLEMGGKVTFTAIVRDVSQQKQMEAKLLQSERLAAVGQAVAHVAHEIKNPLMIIGGFSSQIRESLGQEKDVQKLDMILDEVERLERLVADLGDFTKEYRLVKRVSDVNSVIGDVVKIMSGIYGPDKYLFRESLSSELTDVNCDPDKLKQVFVNIMSNGFEAMAEGGTLSVSTEKIPGGVEIRIGDEGRGIPEDALNRIFEPFYTTREKGSGLGLSISYKIIEAHRGDISAVSRLGEGTTFIIRLPEE